MHIADPSFRHTLFSELARTTRVTERASAVASEGVTRTEHGRSAERQVALRVIAGEVLSALGADFAASHHSHPVQAQGYGPADAIGVGAIGQALRAALAASKAEADPVPALLAKLEGGIGAAQEALAKLGFDDADIAHAVAAFRERLSANLGAVARDAQAEAASVTAVSAQAVRKGRGALELVTQDGDVVRIRFRSSEAERIDVGVVENGSTTVVGARIHSFENTRIRVDVQGSLDAGELKAIQDFLGQVDRLADEFFSGDVEAAFAVGAALKFDAGEIARYALKLSVSERISVNALISKPAPAAIATPAPAPAANTPTPAPSSETAASTVPATTSTQSATKTAAPTLSPPQPLSLLETVHAFLGRVLGLADVPVANGRIELSYAFKLRIVAQAIEAARPAEHPTAGSALASASINQAAALSDTALKQAA